MDWKVYLRQFVGTLTDNRKWSDTVAVCVYLSVIHWSHQLQITKLSDYLWLILCGSVSTNSTRSVTKQGPLVAWMVKVFLYQQLKTLPGKVSSPFLTLSLQGVWHTYGNVVLLPWRFMWCLSHDVLTGLQPAVHVKQCTILWIAIATALSSFGSHMCTVISIAHHEESITWIAMATEVRHRMYATLLEW